MINSLNRPLVSILIPTYEQEDQVMKAAESALAQDYPHLEVIVIDDASPHARYFNARKIADPRFRYVRRVRNVGRTENYRRSLRELAVGNWVMVLDGDDYLTDESFISCAMRAIAKDPKIVMVAARSETRSNKRRLVSDHPGNCIVDGLDVLRALPDSRYFIQHLAVLYRRRDAVALDFYRSPAISSDWESLYRLASHGRIFFLDRLVGVWRIHSDNASGSCDGDELIANLAVWRSIYVEAVAQGLPQAEADRACRKIIRYMMRQHIPKVANSWRAFLDYLFQLKEKEPQAVAGIAHVPTLGRLALALLGHYRAR